MTPRAEQPVGRVTGSAETTAVEVTPSAAAGPVLAADLTVPGGAAGLVVFAHGSGSSRHSPRNRLVAAALQRRGLATLLADLLTAEEERVDVRTGELRFDIPLLAGRVGACAAWARRTSGLDHLPLAYFGASTGAAAALVAAAGDAGVASVVSRGGRPDLAGDRLPAVAAPTLLIVGGRDHTVLDLNRAARERLGGPSRLAIVPDAGHLFEEPGALEAVAALAGDWITAHLPPARTPAP